MMVNDSETYTSLLLLGKTKQNNSASPWFSRVYAGYTKSQLELLCMELDERRGQLPIFDPMAGQAFHLSTLTWIGHDVSINDINPAPLLLAWLRSAETLQTLSALISDFETWAKSIRRAVNRLAPKSEGELQFITSWLSESMSAQLQKYSELACTTIPKDAKELFALPAANLFRLAILVLAARRLVCCRQSDNRTWLKPGGLDKGVSLIDCLDIEIKTLKTSTLVTTFQGNYQRLPLGKLSISSVDIARNTPSILRKKCIGVTSPPYANRLDYSVMWSPELWVLSTALPFISRETIKTNQVGSNKVRHDEELEQLVRSLPRETQSQLKQIRDSNTYASASYYYPFFAQFAVDLSVSLQNSCQTAPNAQAWFIFIRDTHRKDVLFSAHTICEQVMREAGFSQRKKEASLKVVKSHVGLVRKAQATASLQGLAQREWWLTFDRKH